MGKSNAKKNQRKSGCWGSDDFARRSYEQSKKQQKRKEALELELKLKHAEDGDGGTDEDRNENRAAATHNSRSSKSKEKDKKIKVTSQERAQILSHGTEDQIDDKRLLLQISKTKREIEALRARLEAWDSVKEKKDEEERAAAFAIEEAKRQAEIETAEKGLPRKRRKRPGPETWKLRGAARPAHEVYDFDVRYVDKYIKEKEEELERAKRVINVLKIYRGKLGTEEAPQPYSRKFLALLFQLGILYLEKKKYKIAREAFRECIELEGTENPITNSRQKLMWMYLETNRPESARRLWERLPNDKSAWIRFSAALIEYVSFNILNEEGSSQESADALLSVAIKANIYCAFYLAFITRFNIVMEYVDEIDDANEGTLEEAIEYCNSDQIGHWYGTDGALDWVKSSLVQIWNGERIGECDKSDLHNWDTLLTQIEYDFEANQPSENETNSSIENNDEKDEEIDVLMYTGMFRTAMGMIIDSGELAME